MTPDPSDGEPTEASVAAPTPEQVAASQYVYSLPSERVTLDKHHLIRLLEHRRERQVRRYPPWTSWVAAFGMCLTLAYTLDAAAFKPFLGAGPAVIHALTLMFFILVFLVAVGLLGWWLVGLVTAPHSLSPEEEVAQILTEARLDEERLARLVEEQKVRHSP